MNISDELAAELLEYFGQRADAEYETESSSPLPNLEMKLLIALEEAARQAPASGEPVALLRREIGESSWFDHTPVKPNTQAAENLKASPIMDYCEVYTHPQPAQQGSVPVSLIDAAYHHFCKLKADYPEFSTVRHTERSRFQAAVNQLLVTLATPQPEGDGWIRCNERFPTQADGDERCSLWVSGLHENTGNRFVMMAFVGEAIDLAKSGGIDYFMPTGLKRPQPPVEQEGARNE